MLAGIFARRTLIQNSRTAELKGSFLLQFLNVSLFRTGDGCYTLPPVQEADKRMRLHLKSRPVGDVLIVQYHGRIVAANEVLAPQDPSEAAEKLLRRHGQD
jgi:hypothetical protein